MSVNRFSAFSSCDLSASTLRRRRSALLIFVFCLRLAMSHMRSAADSAADACTTLCEVIFVCSSVVIINERSLFLFASIFSRRAFSKGVNTFVISSRIFSHSRRNPGNVLERILFSFARRSRHGPQLHGHPRPCNFPPVAMNSFVRSFSSSTSRSSSASSPAFAPASASAFASASSTSSSSCSASEA